MFINLKRKIAKYLYPQIFLEVETIRVQAQEIEQSVNQRVAKIVSDLDPFEPILRKYHGVFSEQFTHPEEKLDDRGQLLMMTWGYQQKHDPSFKHITDWLLNTQGNNTLRKAKNDYEWFYGRAAIVNIELFVKEVGRLATLYEELLEKNKIPKVNEQLTME